MKQAESMGRSPREDGLGEEFSVRPPKRADLANIHRIYLESWKKTYDGYGLNWSNKRILEDLHSEKYALSSWVVAEYGDELVGFLRHSSCLRRLDKIFVAPSYWKTGAGVALMEEYMARVGDVYPGPIRLSLEVFRMNTNAHRFFTIFGYEHRGVSWNSPTSKKEILLMEKIYERAFDQGKDFSKPILY